MKTKIITWLVLTGILATWAFVYADSSTGSLNKWFGMMRGFWNSAYESVIDKLLNGDTLTAADKATVQQIKTQRATMKANIAAWKTWSWMMRGWNRWWDFWLKNFLSTTLTQDQQTQLKTLETNFWSQTKALMTSLRWSWSTTTPPTTDQINSLKTQFTTIWTSYMQSIRPFVSADKLTAFDAFVAKGPQWGFIGWSEWKWRGMMNWGFAGFGRGMMKGK